MSLGFDPAVVLILLLAQGLYVRAVRVLAARGYDVPRGQQVAWHAGILLTGAGLLGPVDALAEDLLIAHMGQHLLIADLAAPFLLVGIRSPVFIFLLPRAATVAMARRTRLRAFFRWIRRPLVAVPIWIAVLYGWHFSFAFEAALRHDLVHVAQHQSFVLASVLVWWSVIDPKRRRLSSDLWKVPYLLGARLPGMLLGMAFILLRSPAYPDPYAVTTQEHGLSTLTDQQVAGGMMMALDLSVMLFAVMFFFYRSAKDHDRAERAATAVAG